MLLARLGTPDVLNADPSAADTAAADSEDAPAADALDALDALTTWN